MPTSNQKTTPSILKSTESKAKLANAGSLE
jgi:hypothetical protein